MIILPEERKAVTYQLDTARGPMLIHPVKCGVTDQQNSIALAFGLHFISICSPPGIISFSPALSP